MNLGYILFWAGGPILLGGELAAAFYLSRRRVRHRLAYVYGSYSLFLVLAAALAYSARPDDLGFGSIPMILLTAPWCSLPLFRGANLPGCMLAGLGINCLLILAMDRLGYSTGAKPSDLETSVTP